MVNPGKGGSYATLSFWTRDNNACGFVNVFADTRARVGANGITNGVTRTQGTSTTPSGTYTMTEAFGLNSSPGSALTYGHVGAGDYWVEDNNSAYYNTYRNVAQGGFKASLPLSDPNGSERLSNYPTQYGYSIVVNFNRAPDTKTPYRGAGIFVTSVLPQPQGASRPRRRTSSRCCARCDRATRSPLLPNHGRSSRIRSRSVAGSCGAQSAVGGGGVWVVTRFETSLNDQLGCGS